MELTATKIIDYVRQDFDANYALQTISSSCDGECYLVGGVVRDSILKSSYSGDLDIIVPNDDLRAYKALDDLGVICEINRPGSRRYDWNYRQIDIFEPKAFYGGFSNIDNALRFFDLKINALALHLRSGQLLDPLDGETCLSRREIGINWDRWNSPHTTTEGLWKLLIRLARTLHNVPSLSLSIHDAKGLRNVVQHIDHEAWDGVRHRFPPGRSVLLGIIENILLKRVQSNPNRK